MTQVRKLRVFLCHASEDNLIVDTINELLKQQDWIDTWIDDEDLLPGQEFELVIEEAIRSADVVLICLSTKSVKKEGYVQREVKLAIDYAKEKPDDTIYLVPLLLDDCIPPTSLKRWKPARYSSGEDYEKLLESLKIKASNLPADQDSAPMGGKPGGWGKTPIRTKRIGFRSVVKMFLGIMLPFFACVIIATVAGSQKYFDGVWANRKEEIIFTVVAFCGLLFLSFYLFIDGLWKLTSSTVKGIGQLNMVPAATTIDIWLNRMKALWNGMYDKDVFTRQIEKVRESAKTLQVKENWIDPEFKERLMAALWSLFVPGLGLFRRGRKLLGVSFLLATTVGYFAEVLPGVLLHLTVIVLSGVLDDKNESGRTSARDDLDISNL